MSKTANILKAPPAPEKKKAYELKKNVDYLGPERIFDANYERKIHLIKLPKGMSLDQMRDPVFYRMTENKQKILANDKIEVIGHNFTATLFMRGYAAGFYADPIVEQYTSWEDSGPQILNDDGSNGYTVKFIDAQERWAVLDKDGRICSSKHFSREKAIDDLDRIKKSPR